MLRLACCLLLVCCSSEKHPPGPGPAREPSPGPAREPSPGGAGSAAARTDELFHVLDRAPFHQGEALAVGGEWVYWIQDRADDPRHSQRQVMRKRTTGGAAEVVTEPGKINAIAADVQALYVAGNNSVWERSHRGGERIELASGAWTHLEPAERDLVVVNPARVALLRKHRKAEPEVLWQGEPAKHSVVAEVDRFFFAHDARDREPQRRGADVPITVVESGRAPAVIANANVNSYTGLGVHRDHLYFVAPTPPSCRQAPPCSDSRLWRVHKVDGGMPEPVGDASWHIKTMLIRNGVLIAAMHSRIFRLDLDTGSSRVLDALAPPRVLPLGIAGDDRHVYYFSGREIRRVTL